MSNPIQTDENSEQSVPADENDRMYLKHVYNSLLQNELRREVFVATYHIAMLGGSLTNISALDEGVILWYGMAHVAWACHVVGVILVSIGFDTNRRYLIKEAEGYDGKPEIEIGVQPRHVLIINGISLYTVPLALIFWFIFLFLNRDLILG